MISDGKIILIFFFSFPYGFDLDKQNQDGSTMCEIVVYSQQEQPQIEYAMKMGN